MENRKFISEVKDDVNEMFPAGQEHDASSSAADLSARRMEKDFKDTPKYNDIESYASQHHHSIGTGLFLTDAIKDLPPRFRDKVIKALEEGAAVNNIPLEKIPVDSLFSAHGSSNGEEKKLDSLIIQNPSSSRNASKSSKVENSQNAPTKKEYNSRKGYKSSHDSNSNLSSKDMRQRDFKSSDNINSDFAQSNDCTDNKRNFKSGSHVSTHNLRDNNKKGSYHHQEKVVQNSEKNTSHFVAKSNSSQIHIPSSTSQQWSKYSLPQRNSNSAATKKLDKKSESGFQNERTNNYELNKFNPNKTFNSSQYASDSSGSSVKSKFSKSRHFNPKQQDYHDSSNKLNENFSDKSLSSRESFHSDASSVSFQAKTRIGNNLSGKRTEFHSDVGRQNRSRAASASSQSSSIDSHSSSNKFIEKFNGKSFSSKESFHSDTKSISSFKGETKIGNNLSGKRTESHSEVRWPNRFRAAASSYSSPVSYHDKDKSYNKAVYDNREHKKFPFEPDRNLEIPKGSFKTEFGSVSSLPHMNPAHKQNAKNMHNSREMPENPRCNSDSSSQFSNTYGKRQNSLGHKHSDINSQFGSSCRHDKNLNKRNDREAVPNKNHQDEDIPKVPYTNDSRNCNPQQSNYHKSNKFISNVEKYSEKNSQSCKFGLKNTHSDQGLNSRFSKESNKLRNNDKKCIENGFFVKIEVSEKARNLEYWVTALRNIFSFPFELERCCHFSDILILEFDRKEQAKQALFILWRQKRKHQNSKLPHVINISTLIYRLFKPCSCKQNVIHDSLLSLEKHSEISLNVVQEKIEEIQNFTPVMKKGNFSKHNLSAKKEMLKAFVDSKSNFLSVQKDISEKIESAESLKEIQQLKVSFIRECNAFKRCLPIYSKKKEIMNSVRFYSVSVIVAETGSGKSTQIVEYLLHSDISERGLIICTQPRKLAAISIAQFVSGQVGSALGKVVGYDVGMERRYSEVSKIIYMTDYCLLKKFIRDPTLKGVSCVIIDEAHERSLYTDLVLGMLKSCIQTRLDLRVIITSATINPTIFIDYFKMPPESVIEVPGRSYPVDVIWWPEDVDKGWNYVDACVHKVFEIYKRQPVGDILVFLTSANESEEAIYLLKRLLSSKDKKLHLLSLHGKSDIHEQMQVFQTLPHASRKIVFATNVAETSVTIPGIKYVVDSGMTKDLKFDPKMNKSYLEVTFINKSASEQRKGRAGRTQSGICYRMYSKRNFAENMTDNALPEVLKTNLQRALLKIFELGINPKTFNFIETPPERTISNSIDSLGYLGAIENDKLTQLGRKIAKLPVEPQLAKLIVQGIEADIGYEIIIIAAMVNESSKLFIRNEENRTIADEKRKKFLQEGGDLCTYLEIYKRWKEIAVGDRFRWCVDNYISSKAMRSAAKSVFEIIFSLRTELRIQIDVKFNSSAFKKQYEKILFDCFSENLCVSSGHPKLGYLSPYLPESFFIHPSSTIAYLGKDSPEFLVYRTLMETSRNFLFDITPISEETIRLANQNGSFQLPLHSLKSMQMPPKVIGPFGESVLVRYILGKQGSKIKELEAKIQRLTNVKNAYVDVAVDKGLITVYSAQRFHEKVSKEIYQVVEQAHNEILKEEDVIKYWGTSMHFALCAGGLINDIIMPGEFKELIFRNVRPKEENNLEKILSSYGPLQSVCHSSCKQETQICVTFKKVCDAQKAFLELKDNKMYSVSSKPYLPNVNDSTLPLYMLNVSWCRRPCTGRGSVEFFSEEDLIVASGILTRSSFTLENNMIFFTPSENSSKELTIKNLPETVHEQAVKRELRKCLPDDIKIKQILIIRRQCNIEIKTAKEKLLQLFKCHVPTTKVVIDMKNRNNEELWKASVYFDCLEDVENAFIKIKNNTKIDSYPLMIKQVFKSSLHCKKEVYFQVSKQVMETLESKKREGICEEFSVKQLDTNYGVSVEFTCININELNKTRQSLRVFLLGERMDLVGTSKYDFLFSDCHRELIKQIQRSTNTWIDLNIYRKVITIYGSSNNCQKAKEEIYSLASSPDFSFTRTFNLRDSCIPAGFLKELFIKYGFDLHGLVNEFELTLASVDNFGQNLTLKGLKKGIKKAEQKLEELCEKLFKSRGERKKTSSQEEICPICFDPVSYDFQRLEHCGHAFCRQCLLLQVESKTMPVVCVKENCGKLIVLEDIKRIISFGGDHLRKTFCTVALQHHVSCNVGKISYCPTPDCQMVYRLSKEGSEYNCSACKNTTCTRCQAPYHYGMSCEMFQNCLEDEDYSLKTWVKENESSLHHCPSCKTIIEKAGGCNHMECLNCKVHFCWLCLQIFPSGSEVYDHMPYCPKNQLN